MKKRPLFSPQLGRKGLRGSALCCVLIALALLVPAGVRAEGEPVVSASPGEYTLLTGYGITHRGFGATRTQVQTWDAILRYGHFLSAEVGQGAWYQGRHELLAELPLHVAVDHDGRVMAGGYLLGSWKFTGLGEQNLYPYAFAGGGVLFVDLGLPTMSDASISPTRGGPASSTSSAATSR